jgi:hypothetical protein
MIHCCFTRLFKKNSNIRELSIPPTRSRSLSPLKTHLITLSRTHSTSPIRKHLLILSDISPIRTSTKNTTLSPSRINLRTLQISELSNQILNKQNESRSRFPKQQDDSRTILLNQQLQTRIRQKSPV